MKNIWSRLILGFFTTFASTTSFADLTCQSLLGLTDLPNMIEVFEDPEGIYNGTSLLSGRSVVYSGLTKDHVSFRKIYGRFWYSNAKVLPEGNTDQGNPAILIHLLGNELAHLLGFRVLQQMDKTIQLWAPRAEFLKRKLDHINHYFKIWGLEPISFLPRATDFVSEPEILKLGSKGIDDYHLLFAYADAHRDLAVHEVSFHLGAILYPQLLLKRAREINEAYLKFLPYLLEQPGLSEFRGGLQGMIHSRASELDFGTANPQIYLDNILLLKTRRAPDNPERDFSILEKIGHAVEGGGHHFDLLMHSEFKPSEVVALNLMRQFGLQDTPEFRQIAKGRVFYSKYTQAIVPSFKAKLVILMSLVPILKKQAETESEPARHAKTLFLQMADQLPKRLKKMQEALSLPEPP